GFSGCTTTSACGGSFKYGCANVSTFNKGWATSIACNSTCNNMNYVACLPGGRPPCGQSGQYVSACGTFTPCASSCGANSCECGMTTTCQYTTATTVQRCK